MAEKAGENGVCSTKRGVYLPSFHPLYPVDGHFAYNHIFELTGVGKLFLGLFKVFFMLLPSPL